MKIDLYDKTGKKTTKKADLEDAIWKVPLNKDLVAQAVYIYLHNQRKGTAHTKTRAEVRGGGRKPWRQKGTGRARHGSIRSPLWVGGGVAFGPRSHKRLKKMPVKMQHAALCGLLSERVREEKVLVLEDFSAVKSAKTKGMVSLLEKLDLKGNKALIIVTKEDKDGKNMVMGSKNLEGVKVRNAMDLNMYDVINADELILVPSSVKKLEGRLK